MGRLVKQVPPESRVFSDKRILQTFHGFGVQLMVRWGTAVYLPSTQLVVHIAVYRRLGLRSVFLLY